MISHYLPIMDCFAHFFFCFVKELTFLPGGAILNGVNKCFGFALLFHLIPKRPQSANKDTGGLSFEL